jgi:hypothetical protein
MATLIFKCTARRDFCCSAQSYFVLTECFWYSSRTA